MSDSTPSKWPRFRPWIALALLAGGLASLALVAAAAWKGAPFSLGSLLYIKPARYLRIGAILLVGAWLVWNSGRGSGVLGKAIAKLVMLSFSLALSLAAGEIGLRIYVQQKQQTGGLEQLKKLKASGQKIPVRSTHPLAKLIEPVADARRAYEMASNLDVDFGHRRVHLNSAGMRSTNEYTVARIPHSVRIAGIGDSGMFGWDCEQGEDYMSVLERTLNTRGDGVRYEALNFGTPGYNTDQEVACFEKKVAAYKPDIVIVGWCENDYDLSMFVSQKTNFEPGESRLKMLLFKREEFWKKVAGHVLGTRRTGEFEQSKITDDMISGTAVEGVTRAFRELQEHQKRDSFKLMVFGAMNPKTTNMLAKLGIDYYNSIERIPHNTYPAEWAVYYMHPRPQGHRVLGERLARELDDKGWLTPAR